MLESWRNEKNTPYVNFRVEKQNIGPGLQVQLPHPEKRVIFFCLTVTEDVRLHDKRLKWRRCQWSGRGILGALERAPSRRRADGSAGMCVNARCRWGFGLRLRLSADLRSAWQLDKRLKKRLPPGWTTAEAVQCVLTQNGSGIFIMFDLTWIIWK